MQYILACAVKLELYKYRARVSMYDSIIYHTNKIVTFYTISQYLFCSLCNVIYI